MCVKAIECPYDGENQQKKQHSYIYIYEYHAYVTQK